MKLGTWIAAVLLAASPVAAAAQLTIDRPGTIAHQPAGAYFPERVGEFRRARIVQYDRDGANLGATYELVRGADLLVLTVYVYPVAGVAAAPGSAGSAAVARAMLCDQELRSIGIIIENQPHYRGARRIEEGSAPAVDGVARALSRRSVHSFSGPFNGRVQEVRSETDLYCFVGGDWLVKYRATSNAGFDASRAIEQFIRSGPWPGRNPPPAPEETVMAPDRILERA